MVDLLSGVPMVATGWAVAFVGEPLASPLDLRPRVVVVALSVSLTLFPNPMLLHTCLIPLSLCLV